VIRNVRGKEVNVDCGPNTREKEGHKVLPGGGKGSCPRWGGGARASINERR